MMNCRMLMSAEIEDRDAIEPGQLDTDSGAASLMAGSL